MLTFSYPPGVPRTLTVEPTTVSQVLSRSAGRYADRPALVFMGAATTFGQLNDLVNRLAAALADLGVRPGDRVALLLPNVPQFVVANYAVLRSGAVSCPVNPLYTEPELAYQLNDAGAETLVVLDSLYAKAAAVRAQTPLRRILVCHLNDLMPIPAERLPPGAYVAVAPTEGVHAYAEVQQRYPAGHAFTDRSAWNDLAVLLYTGGTTGQSKGVMLTHANLAANVQQVRAYFGDVFADGQERFVAIYPFFHAAGYTAIQLFGLSYGVTLALVPRPEPDGVMALLETFRPTYLQAVSTLFVGLQNHPRWPEADLSSIRYVGTGAAPMAAAVYHALKAKCPDAEVYEVYGMTEISPMGTSTPLGIGRFKQGSVGLPFPGTDLKLVDLETGDTELTNGQTGEVCFRGPQVMQGYLNKPDATAEVLRHGWMHTGDVGYVDDEGWLYIVDRKKDMILASGYNVYPKELDEVLYGHPAVLEACCIGVPDAYRGETVKAYVVTKPGASLTAEEVTQFCRARLAAYKVPRIIEFVAELPKSAVGKILRRELRRIDEATRATTSAT